MRQAERAHIAQYGWGRVENRGVEEKISRRQQERIGFPFFTGFSKGPEPSIPALFKPSLAILFVVNTTPVSSLPKQPKRAHEATHIRHALAFSQIVPSLIFSGTTCLLNHARSPYPISDLSGETF